MALWKGKESIDIETAQCMTGNGKMESAMGLAEKKTKMATSTKEIGKITADMGRELQPGKQDNGTKESSI